MGVFDRIPTSMVRKFGQIPRDRAVEAFDLRVKRVDLRFRSILSSFFFKSIQGTIGTKVVRGASSPHTLWVGIFCRQCQHECPWKTYLFDRASRVSANCSTLPYPRRILALKSALRETSESTYITYCKVFQLYVP